MTNARIASLDGLRALAITLVIAMHLHSGHTIPALDYLWRCELLGDIGVRIFFVISGFLITTLLSGEFRARGEISLRHFYLRRALRIWPAYYLLLGVLAAAMLMGLQTLSWRDLAGPASFLANYFPTSMVLAHSWSLAVEEQFYLIWPLLIVLAGWRRATFCVIAFCLAAPCLRGFELLAHSPEAFLWSRFEHAGDAIGWGCLYALARERGRLPKLAAEHAAYLAWGALAGLLALSVSSAWPLFWSLAGSVIANGLAVLLIHGALNAEGTLIFRLLNSAPVRKIGALSYSLYLWQQVFIYGNFRLPAPWNLMAIFAAASFSYYAVELNFLRWKERQFASARTSPASAGAQLGAE
ncbi:acyltransferase family protein [Niveibacterium terrae]|uniref:acyltransferase family protein n=1 Tax=Niveibacterium terrae TaxID=3373598 RepID=UPI003A8FE8CA